MEPQDRVRERQDHDVVDQVHDEEEGGQEVAPLAGDHEHERRVEEAPGDAQDDEAGHHDDELAVVEQPDAVREPPAWRVPSPFRSTGAPFGAPTSRACAAPPRLGVLCHAEL